MASPKAQFNGQRDALRAKAPRDLSDQEWQELRALLADALLAAGRDDGAPESAHPPDNVFHGAVGELAERLVAAARPAATDAHWQREEVTNGDAQAELRYFAQALAALDDLRTSLRKISPTVDRSLGAGADPLGLADGLDALQGRAAALRARVQQVQRTFAPNAATVAQRRSAAAVTMAAGIGRVLAAHGIPVVAKSSAHYSDYNSTAVRVLMLIGQGLGFSGGARKWHMDLDAANKRPAEEARQRQHEARQRQHERLLATLRALLDLRTGARIGCDHWPAGVAERVEEISLDQIRTVFREDAAS